MNAIESALQRLTPAPPNITQVSYWATVTQASPLRVQLDGDPGPLPITPDTLVSGLAENDRVWVALTTNDDPTFRGRRVVVVGRSGGGVTIPAGVIVPYAGSTAPDGWLMCDGEAHSRTTYAKLFAAIGTTYGAGNGSTTFNVPNIKGRVPVGRDTSQNEFDTLGETGGETAHTLTIAELPAHDHGSAGSHTHNIPLRHGGTLGESDASDRAARMFGGTVNANSFFTSSDGSHTHSTVGSGQAHNNLQPYIVLNYIIKT